MSSIRIKNFGPIRAGFSGDKGWMDIKEVTIFIGNQGTGKSTVAKLISTFTWMEKALVRGDYPEREFTSHRWFITRYCSYHKLENYFEDLNGQDRAEIEYNGQAYYFRYAKSKLSIVKKNADDYPLPQIMYVPADRNFISSNENAKNIKFFSEPLVEFLSEYDKSKIDLKEPLSLPINNTKVEYDRLNDIVNIRGKDYKVRLSEASSGFQSSVPLFLVSRFLTNNTLAQANNQNNDSSADERNRFRSLAEIINADPGMTVDQKRIAISAFSKKFNKTAFINIVEEPEQNLYPTSQRDMLYSLLTDTNVNPANKLILTTHSPYLINYLTLAVKAWIVGGKILIKKDERLAERIALTNRLDSIVPVEARLNAEKLAIYELGESGDIIRLGNYDGMPDDDNFLNNKLNETNEQFAEMLDIEDYADKFPE